MVDFLSSSRIAFFLSGTDCRKRPFFEVVQVRSSGEGLQHRVQLPKAKKLVLASKKAKAGQFYCHVGRNGLGFFNPNPTHPTTSENWIYVGLGYAKPFNTLMFEVMTDPKGPGDNPGT